jgi:RNA polymerase sigma-70 factor (ECF subfamily)
MILSGSAIAQSGIAAQALAAMAPDDAPLVAAARADPQAFAPLYARYLQPVYLYCYRRLGTRTAAEDATSEVFLKALAGLPRYREDSFRGWLFTIARNVTVDAVRRQHLQESLEAAGELVDTAPTPEEETVSTETQRALLARLPDDQRHIVELRLAGLTGAEIARVLGHSLGSVKAMQFRAFARLRRVLTGAAAPTEEVAP